MRAMGLQGIIPGKPIRTAISDKAAPCRLREPAVAPAPNMLWLSDFTYVQPGRASSSFELAGPRSGWLHRPPSRRRTAAARSKTAANELAKEPS
ncbi:hypothetical protein BN77_p10001 [Rhizobium mesoamericanum STM3625]|uniref:Transposase n=1 Tax=Rhizobium mesoamericanum STM3625 TaxID=1211777 RepID=K0Q4T5_9HYPH|nr:hypothetical protein BN77_p10001 [Rhizobium mesoamericanum STM3625]